MVRPIKKYNNKTQYLTKYGYIILYDNEMYLNRGTFKKGIQVKITYLVILEVLV
jgi:hypothetical protein